MAKRSVPLPFGLREPVSRGLPLCRSLDFRSLQTALLALGLINAGAPLTDRLTLGAFGIDSLSPGVGCRPCEAGLRACVLIDRNDLPKHLFGIPDLDLSEDPCAEALAGPWFRLGARRTGSGRDKQGVENVVSTARA